VVRKPEHRLTTKETIMTLLDQRPSTEHIEALGPSPPRAKWWLGPVAVLAAAVVAVGVIALVRQGDDTQLVESAPELVDTYTPAGARLAHGVLDGTYAIPDRSVIPEAPMLPEAYTPQRSLSNDVLDGVFVIPEAPVLKYDTYTTPGSRTFAGMLDGVYDPADAPRLTVPPDAYSGTMRRPGLPDGEWVRPLDPSIYPCRISGPC
jgi:hypothetical protein